MKNNLFDFIADSKTINNFNITNHVEKLNKSYQKTHRFLDNHFSREIKENLNKFHQRWFEMQLIEKLLAANINLVQCNEGQPDIQIKLLSGNTLWIECTAPTPGEYKDKIALHIEPNKKPGEQIEMQETPINYMLPRITSAVKAKIEQYEKCKQATLFNQNDIHVLVMNIALFSPFLRQPFIGIFSGFKNVYFDWHAETIITPPCKSITKPTCNNLIEIGYLNNPDFPFNAVILSSEKLGSISSTPGYYKPLLKPSFDPTHEIITIFERICA